MAITFVLKKPAAPVAVETPAEKLARLKRELGEESKPTKKIAAKKISQAAKNDAWKDNVKAQFSEYFIISNDEEDRRLDIIQAENDMAWRVAIVSINDNQFMIGNHFRSIRTIEMDYVPATQLVDAVKYLIEGYKRFGAK